MMIPEYMRFYSNTTEQVLGLYAVTFFSLANAMYRLQARETMRGVLTVSTGMSGKDGSPVIDDLKKQEKGIHGILQEVRNLRGVKR